MDNSTNSVMNENVLKNYQTHANRGTGSGGANTNLHGKRFEEKTNNQYRLLDMGFVKNEFSKKTGGFYLTKIYDNKKVVFVSQNNLKKYVKEKYGIHLFRCPDEAYIIEYGDGKKVIKILEKKEQRVEGSVETKLWSGHSLKREYELVLGNDFVVHYAFCVNSFLQTKLSSNHKKYTILNTILNESDISVLFGDNDNYFETVDKWFNSS